MQRKDARLKEAYKYLKSCKATSIDCKKKNSIIMDVGEGWVGNKE